MQQSASSLAIRFSRASWNMIAVASFNFCRNRVISVHTQVGFIDSPPRGYLVLEWTAGAPTRQRHVYLMLLGRRIQYHVDSRHPRVPMIEISAV